VVSKWRARRIINTAHHAHANETLVVRPTLQGDEDEEEDDDDDAATTVRFTAAPLRYIS
jgi:hypothetical protein